MFNEVLGQLQKTNLQKKEFEQSINYLNNQTLAPASANEAEKPSLGFEDVMESVKEKDV